MAPDDTQDGGPSIAPPSLGFGFRRKKKAAADPIEPDPEPAPGVESPAPATPEASARRASIFDAPAASTPEGAPEREPVVEPEPEPKPVPEPAPAFETSSIIPGMRDEPTVLAPAVVQAERPADETSIVPAEPRARRRLVSVPGWYAGRGAAMLTGLVVGLAVVGATALVLRLCTLVRGTSTCGGAGFFLLLVILVAAVVLGSRLLRLGRVPDSGSTSFLAIGLLAVVTLVFLVGSVYDWWMVIAIPLICVATYAASWWVTTRVVGNDF